MIDDETEYFCFFCLFCKNGKKERDTKGGDNIIENGFYFKSKFVFALFFSFKTTQFYFYKFSISFSIKPLNMF